MSPFRMNPRPRMNPAVNLGDKAILWGAYMYGGISGSSLSHPPVTYTVHEHPARLEVVKHGPKCEAADEHRDTDGKCSCPGELYGPYAGVYWAMRHAEDMNAGSVHYQTPPLIKKTSGYR